MVPAIVVVDVFSYLAFCEHVSRLLREHIKKPMFDEGLCLYIILHFFHVD